MIQTQTKFSIDVVKAGKNAPLWQFGELSFEILHILLELNFMNIFNIGLFDVFTAKWNKYSVAYFWNNWLEFMLFYLIAHLKNSHKIISITT